MGTPRHYTAVGRDPSHRLSLRDIRRNPSSYVDPQGYVFHHNGAFYRAIRKRAAPFYRRLFERGLIDVLVSRHRLVPSAIADLQLDDDDVEFVISHQTIEPESFCVEWCPAMLGDAARATVELLASLLKWNATLQDAYPWNIVFRGTEPIFVDLTSIVDVDTPLMWPAYEQYQAFFVRPLMLAEQGKGLLARSLLMNNISGVSRQQVVQYSSLPWKISHPLSSLACRLDVFIQGHPRLKQRLNRLSAEVKKPVDPRVRERFCQGLRRELETLGRHRREDAWSLYYQTLPPGVDTKAKITAVDTILDRLRPPTVVDIGCNTGVFSIVAAERGARVMSIDSSEASISSLYGEAKERGLTITPLIADVLSPTPAFGFMAAQYRSLIERARADTVLCLALMHHLHVTGRQSFDRIAKLMDALAAKHLVFEFVDVADPQNDQLGAGRCFSTKHYLHI